MKNTDQTTDELPKQYDHTAAQDRWYKFWEERGYFNSDPPTEGGRRKAEGGSESPSPAHPFTPSPPHPEHPHPGPLPKGEGARGTKGPFTIVIPPPNVTGALHLGHALNNTLQDIVIRFKRMQGYNTLWMPGTDHAGIATQAVVERRLREEEGLDRHKLGREKLVERIWQWKHDYEKRIIGQLKQMGCSCDWRRTRFTLDEICARAVRHTFFRMFRDGLIFRGKRLVNWDTYLQTAVADDEVYHDTVKGHFWHFRYPVIDPQPGEPEFVTIATTRPETMLGDTAVAVHPDPASALAKAEAELKAKLSAAPAKEKAAIEGEIESLSHRRQAILPQLEKLRDMARAGRKLMLPLLNRPIPLIADIWAKPELGSGCVKITPAHDPNDYDVWQRNKEIGAINILNPDGTLNDAAGPYKGLKVQEARKRVVADLEAAGLLEKVENREIDLAHSDRSKTPIEPYLADQWFVRMGDTDGKPGLAQMAMNAVAEPSPLGRGQGASEPSPSGRGQGEGARNTPQAQHPHPGPLPEGEGVGRVKITPSRYAKSYLDWLGEKRDWCVSRNLWWGHRIPVWTKAFQGMSDRNEAEKSAKTLYVGNEEVDFWMQWDPDTFEGSAYLCLRDEDAELVRKVEAAGFTQEEEVLDTWFSSALWPHSTLGWPGPALENQPKSPGNPEWEEQKYYYPTSVLITSRDIITLWVARMVLTGLYNVGEAPFRDVYIHPKILDGYGETMSKSKGNGVDPIDIISKFGADALRFGLAYLATETQDVRMPVEFECPHCKKLIEQTQKNRTQPRIECKHCGQPFSTQWATKPEDAALPRGAVVSERFELARNFANKLWNASRFALLNLEDGGRRVEESKSRRESESAAAGSSTLGLLDSSTLAALAVEDRWILSRLSTVTAQVTAALEQYKFADAARVLYDFAWDEFCSFYLEMSKTRLQDPATRPMAQRILAHTLDVILRLLHPAMPFITEDVWQRLNAIAPQRGIGKLEAAAESVMIAPWPEADLSLVDEQIEMRFARFQEVLRGLREVRARQGIAPKTVIHFSARCDANTVALLEPMRSFFESMSGAILTAVGPDVAAPPLSAHFTAAGSDVYVDLAEHIDVAAEIDRKQKDLAKLEQMIASKEKQLANEAFVSRAPESVIAKERAALDELRASKKSNESTLAMLQVKIK